MRRRGGGTENVQGTSYIFAALFCQQVAPFHKNLQAISESINQHVQYSIGQFKKNSEAHSSFGAKYENILALRSLYMSTSSICN